MHFYCFLKNCKIIQYADAIINSIDHKKLIKRKFYRNDCTIKNLHLVKDLTKLNINLKNVIIIDNTPSSYSLQPLNGIPISTWNGDPNDKNLFYL